MVIEILIAAAITLTAGYILYKNIKKSSSGKCTSCRDSSGCSSCCTNNNHKN